MSLSERNIVKQSYEINNANYSLNALETDLIMKMISEIKTEDEDFKPYRFKVLALEKALKRKLDRNSIKIMAKELRRKNLTIDKGKDGFLVTGWVSSFEYFSKTGEIELCFDPKLKPYLLQLKSHFVKTDLQQIFKLPSEYSKRLYMIFKQRENICSFKISVIELQKMLEVPKSLLLYGNLKAKVISFGIEQINEKTDLEIEFKEIKTGRAVTSLEFTIKKKNDDFTKDEISVRLSQKEEEFLLFINKKLKAFKATPSKEREKEFKNLCDFNGVEFSKQLFKEAMKRA